MAGELGMSAYLVGGPVRDILLGRPSQDLDLAVEGDGLAFAAALAERLQCSHSRHERFLTATIQLRDGGELDVATARRETYQYPGALPTVAPAALDEDLWRRDLSINALAVALDEGHWGKVHDPCGGCADLSEGLVRVLHDDSFQDDPTRIIRAVGFAVRFGFHLEPHTEDLLRRSAGAGALSTVSPQRRREVLLPLLESPLAPAMVVRLGELGVLAVLGLGEAVCEELQCALARVPEALAALECEGSRSGRGIPAPTQSRQECRSYDGGDRGEDAAPTAALVYLSLLAHRAETDSGNVAAQVQLTKNEQRTIQQTVTALRQPPAALWSCQVRPSELYFAWEGLSRTGGAALWAMVNEPLARERIEKFWHHLRHMKPDIGGDDLIEAGVAPGPQFAEALQEALRLKLDDPHATSAEQLQAALTHLAKNARKI